MLTKRIIPCLDIKDGRTVKGVNFKNLRDAGDPVELAEKYANEKADELVFLDISATEQKRKTLYKLVLDVAASLDIPFTVGGGIKSIKDVSLLLKNGADKVSINSSAVYRPELINEVSTHYGSQCLVVAIDAKKINNKWKVHLVGGKVSTDIDLFKWAKEVESRGAGEILFTSMDNDGTKKGYNIELTNKVTKSIKVPVIASGGVGELKHFTEGACETEASGLLAASVFHFGKFTINEVKKELNKNGVAVRL